MYVSDVSAGTVIPISSAGVVGTPIVDGGLSDYSIAVTPNGRTAYVAGGDKVFPITTSSNVGGALMSVNPVSSAPNALAISPDGTTAYVVSSSSGTVTPIAIATDTVGTPFSVGTGASGIAITPNGHTAYVINSTADTVTPVTLGSNPNVGTAINVGGAPSRSRSLPTRHRPPRSPLRPQRLACPFRSTVRPPACRPAQWRATTGT